MIIILKNGQAPDQVKELHDYLGQYNVKISEIQGEQTTIWGLVGDTTKIDIAAIQAKDVVEDIRRVSEPYKIANRKFHPEDTVIDVCGVQIGGGTFDVIAGPCSVESEEQVIAVAKEVKKSGAKFLRGGAFKPRTSPYAFQGLHDEGLKYLLEAKKETGLPIVTEIMSLAHLDLFEDVDIIQVGARNMQNFELLKELGHCDKPILLKRGLANTL
ncbi:MAG: 3-deoxy-7-phosphoheptulonate synthase, partial [Massilimaliae sp.]|nr:3-deoxy-7-phosphoheptulonate synthase [Massiliimalia sp.]